MKKQITPSHYIASELLSPPHPVTITLIGCGGTGSQVLTNLARLSMALKVLGHPGLHVMAFDSDEVTQANLGRQLFSNAELGMNKATALITRVNRFFGLTWEARPVLFKINLNDHLLSNILITAVDNVAIRKDIGKLYHGRNACRMNRSEQTNYYWLDLGNSRTSGQIVLGTRGYIEQPKKTKNSISFLPSITEMYPDLEKHEKKDQGPSCSLAEALTKQDLFINSIVAQYGVNILWKLFREAKIEYHGLYVNLQNLTTNPIKVK